MESHHTFGSLRPVVLSALALFCLAWVSPLAAAAGAIPGPQGGRVFVWGEKRLELVVASNRVATVQLYDKAMKALPPGAETLTLVAEAPSGKVTQTLKADGKVWSAPGALPKGEGYRVILQVKGGDGKTQVFRVDFQTQLCGECRRQEYACICAHGT